MTKSNPWLPRLFTSAIIAFFLTVTIVAILQNPAAAQTPAPDQSSAVASAAVDTAAAIAQPFIVTFAQKYPWILTALAAIATLRLVFKPIVSALEAFVRSSPSTEDDATFDAVTHSRTFKAVAWLLDYLGSIKVGPQFTAKPQVKTTPAS